MSTQASRPAEYEYVVVGSGAGGGTVAARLAEEGRRVLLLEAGGDPFQMQGGDPWKPDANRLPDDYQVPCFNAFAGENDAMSWHFFVRHYASQELQQRDPKYTEVYAGQRVDGVLYPRAGCLGGCTAHNAMITVVPHNEDWDLIALMTGDSSWSSENMRKYFQRVENCHHRPFWRFIAKLFRWNPTRHGWGGWLWTEKAIPKAALEDKALVTTVIDTAATQLKELSNTLFERIRWFIQGKGDPNDWRLVEESAVGLRYPPLATRGHARNGARERVIDVARRFPHRLTVELDALATRVLFDDDDRAIGVEYLKGARLYRASVDPSGEPGERRQAFASREVILAGGAYNTPQLLMLSGIGPREELEKHGIEVRVDLPGVGIGLQDRYEVGVVNRMNFKTWWVLEGAKFAAGDPQYQQWAKRPRRGVYTTNGAVVAVIKRSFPDRPLPDLFSFGLVGLFRGFFPGYSRLIGEHLNYFTWCVLKAHTNNTAGTVRLRSADPRDVPQIDFHYFTEGNDSRGEDLKSLVEGIKFARQMTAPLKREGLIAEEELPGEALQTDEELGQFVKDQAWGHHASCTCSIGDRAKGGVVNSCFEVHGTKGLRIVDASVFPKIPGFFIVSSIYTIGEKAADVILKDAR
ncbi:MAG TPA: GMC family oxidoreductase [Thermoanaerobaculia bacterium]|nr:GMC family oxidoreductase [Thermoanaerobaculia bacterium]